MVRVEKPLRAHFPNIAVETDLVLPVIYGIYGLSLFRRRDQSTARLVSYAGLIGVGVCSACYHMTLKYHAQMCAFVRVLPMELKPDPTDVSQPTSCPCIS